MGMGVRGMKITKITTITPRGSVDYEFLKKNGIQLTVTLREPDIDFTVSHPTSTEHIIRLKSGVEIGTRDVEAIEQINQYLGNPLYRVAYDPPKSTLVIDTRPDDRTPAQRARGCMCRGEKASCFICFPG